MNKRAKNLPGHNNEPHSKDKAWAPSAEVAKLAFGLLKADEIMFRMSQMMNENVDFEEEIEMINSSKADLVRKLMKYGDFDGDELTEEQWRYEENIHKLSKN